MESKEENVIIFPKWKNTMKEDGLKAIQEKRYEDALEKLNQLLRFQVYDQEVLTGKVICLMELGRYLEAEELCEDLLHNRKHEHYFHYLHIYFTILFQANKYDVLMEHIEEELSFSNTPAELREQFLQLYNMSKNLQADISEKKTSLYTEELFEAIQDKNYKKQWRSILNLRTMKMDAEPSVIALLGQDEIHPVIKTAIFLWLQEQMYPNSIKVEKNGKQLDIKPTEVPEITKHSIYLDIKRQLGELEQQNPTLYQFLDQLLYRYIYVKYPIVPLAGNEELIVECLQVIGNRLMNHLESSSIDSEPQVLHYIKDILHCEQLYLSIIED